VRLIAYGPDEDENIYYENASSWIPYRARYAHYAAIVKNSLGKLKVILLLKRNNEYVTKRKYRRFGR